MIDLLRIPGTWQRPNPPRGDGDHSEFDDSLRNVILYASGEADWEFRNDGHWSSSGHWKIVKGFHLSISVINPDPIALKRHEEMMTFYYHLVAMDGDDRLILQSLSCWDSKLTEVAWTRSAPGREYPVITNAKQP